MSERIGKIARDNWDGLITFRELARMIGVNSPFHAGQHVRNAWDYFNRRGDTRTCSAISRVFRSEKW